LSKSAYSWGLDEFAPEASLWIINVVSRYLFGMNSLAIFFGWDSDPHRRRPGRGDAAAPSQHVVFLLNERGEAFTARGFSKWFAKQCQRIGLNGLSAHGLREAACRRLAEADA
jgi:hypothetical protein